MERITRAVDLHIDIITDILSRLCIEDLVRSKAVCNTWNLITLDPSFRKLQLERASSKDQRIILKTRTNTLLLVDETHGNWICKKLSPEEVFPIYDHEIVASCNGLLCIASLAGTLYAYNPITGVREILLPADYKHAHHMIYYGFGFDSASNKYKIVRVYGPHDDSIVIGNEERATGGEIVTLGEGSWRELEVPVNVLFRDDLDTVVSGGAFHWMIDKNDVRWSGSEGVLALDIHTEKFDTINFNPGIDTINLNPANDSFYEWESHKKILVNFDEKLAIVELKHLLIRVWELTGSRTNDRCFKEFACFSLPPRKHGYPCKILASLSGGNLLVKDKVFIARRFMGHSVSFYNRQGECFSVPQILNAPRHFVVHFFVPTLVSPKDIFCEEK